MNTEILTNVKTGEEISGVVPTILAYSGAECGIDASEVTATLREVNENFTTFDVQGIPGVAAAVFEKAGETLRLIEIVPMSPPGR